MKLQVSFGKQAQAYLQHYANSSERELFYYLINIDEFPSVGPRAQQLVEHYLNRVQALLKEEGSLPQHLQTFSYTPEAFAERIATLYQQQRNTPIISTSLSIEQLNYILRQYAPNALIDGCWLQNISLAANNHSEITACLFHIYTQKIGAGNTTRHYGNLYRDLLRSARINLPEINTRLFSNQSGFSEHAFTGPVFQLALSLFPRVWLAEILGFTLGHFFVAQDRLLVSVNDELKRHGLDERYCQHYLLSEQPGEQAQLAQKAVVLYLEQFDDEGERQQQWQRIWSGLLVHRLINEQWLADLNDVISQPRTLTPHQKMLELVRAKAPHARNMHRKRKLGGTLINDWFGQEPFDAEGFLKTLAASPYVNLKSPLDSVLLNRSIRFGGPMFRIFTDAEVEVMTEWVQSLTSEAESQPSADKAPATDMLSAPLPIIADENDTHPDLATYAKCSKRELYYYFVNADLYPDVLPTARKLAGQYFKQARADMGKRNCPEHLRFFPYSHDAFEARIYQIYQSETGSYENTFDVTNVQPRELMVWFTRQYAPFPMVDGSWVQTIAKAGTSHTEISARLFRIYSDEVGNADTVMNHPNVYRRLLQDAGIDMPPTDSIEFARQPELLDLSFDIPLLTLSVSMFPRALLPEIIGVNLAIELSGLGKDYMDIIDELGFQKIDPYFFTLHLTIDNIASGHTAIAMSTVHLYLDQILASQGQQAAQREWKRIWVGFIAFEQTMKRFEASLYRQAATHT